LTDCFDIRQNSASTTTKPGVILLLIEFMNHLHAEHESHRGTSGNSSPIHILNRRVMQKAVRIEEQSQLVSIHFDSPGIAVAHEDEF
jgi:hypothetical protein